MTFFATVKHHFLEVPSDGRICTKTFLDACSSIVPFFGIGKISKKDRASKYQLPYIPAMQGSGIAHSTLHGEGILDLLGFQANDYRLNIRLLRQTKPPSIRDVV
eukprot:gene15246-6454_t